MDQLLNQLIVYRSLKEDPILAPLADAIRAFNAGSQDRPALVSTLYGQINQLLAVATDFGFDRNLWHRYVAYRLACTENPFTLLAERTGARPGSVNQLVTDDLSRIQALYHYDFQPLEKALGLSCFSLITRYQALPKSKKQYNHVVSEKIQSLSLALDQAWTAEDWFKTLTAFYQQEGVGAIGLNHAFRLAGAGPGLSLRPVTDVVDVSLDDLIGLDQQKALLRANTEAFLAGKKANNLLLYGDSGTGKSTCVKALLHEYAHRGLRVIEVYKHQFQDLPWLIEHIKQRRYRFLIFMDDLSFEEFETDFKHLKAVIEGGIEVTPDNVLMIATSNRRHLIRETWTDRSDAGVQNDVHHSDTAEEKQSLVNRFGLTLYFPRPSQQEYLAIVDGLASQHPELKMPRDVLLQKARDWGLWHGSVSGRRARQFINDLLAQAALGQTDPTESRCSL